MTDTKVDNIYNQLGLNTPRQTKEQANDELGQAAFLQLMTTQLRNQDPLKPMENGDFLGQMAQFGTVSGINNLNDSFSSMSASMQSNQALQASTLVGKRVMVPADSANLKAGNNIQGAIELDSAASKIVLTVKNSSGQVVHRSELGVQQKGLVDFQWNGLDADGVRQEPGQYEISAEVHRGGDVNAGKLLTVADVESVTLGVGGQNLTLSLSGLGEYDMSKVRKIL